MDPETAVILSAIAASVSAFAALVTAAVATSTLTGSRQDSRDRTRPHVIAELQKSPLSAGSLDLVVQNYGMTPALNLRVQFDPPVKDLESLPDSDIWSWIGQRYRKSIPMLPPGGSLANVFRAGHDDVSPVTVKLVYAGLDGSGYHAHFFLDPDPLLKESRVTPGKETPTEKRMVAAAESIARSLYRGAKT